MPLETENTPPDPASLSLEQLSPELRSSMLEALGPPVIELALDGVYAGSGVLVEVDGVSGILTAEHVVFNSNMPFEKAKGLYSLPHFYSIDRSNLRNTHFSATNIRMDLLRWYPETPS